MKYLALIIAIAITIPVFGQRKKKEDEIVVEPTFVEGVVYALPLTGVRVYVTAEKENFTPGPFSAYAEQLLGIKNARNKPDINWNIKALKIVTFAQPDPGELHKAMGSEAFLLNLTADGCLAGINRTPDKNEPPRVVTNNMLHKVEKDDGFSFDNFTDTPFYTEGDSTNGFQPVRVNVAQKAAEAAKRILDSRLVRYDMVAGLMDEFHPDGKAYDESLKELKRIEKNYLSLFIGRTTYDEESFSFDFIPSKNSGKGEVIFRISKEKGIVPASDLSGKPVLIEFEREQNVNKKLAALSKSENPNAGESGLFYRVPVTAKINIIQGLNIIASAQAAIAQFGVVAPLPDELLSGEYAVEIHPETGAIKSISKK